VITLRVLAAVVVSLLSSSRCEADEVLTLTHQGVARSAILHTSPSSSPTPGSRPLVIALAGKGVAVADFQRWAGFDAVADREGFVVVYPDAVEKEWSYGRPIVQPMPGVAGQTVDDVGFIARLLGELITRKIVDPARVYVVGSSRGGYLTYTLACAMSDRIAAAAAYIATMTEFQREDCRPARPVPLMVIAGTDDPANPYAGWRGLRGRLLSVTDTLEFWRGADPTRVAVIEWMGCRTPGALRLYRIDGGGHHAPALTAARNERFGWRNGDFDTADETWAFLRGFAR